MAVTFASLVPPILAQRGMMPDWPLGAWRFAAYGSLALVALVLIWMSNRGPADT